MLELALNDLFDTVFSIHTFYFWDDPASIVTGIARVLKLGGRVVIIASPGRVDEDDDPLTISLGTKKERLTEQWKRSECAMASLSRTLVRSSPLHSWQP